MMELIKWNAKYSVGVDEIDAQHQQLFALLNRFIENFGGEGKEGLGDVLEEMVNYIDYHFKFEEKFFQTHPQAEAHRREHYEFVKKTLQLQKEYREKRVDITRDALQFLIAWLKNHILGTDKKYFDEMKMVSS